MKTVFYKIECITNLHVGSGEINYNIVDNEVEKDPVTGYPVVHASGIKGSLRDAMKNLGSETVDRFFGSAGNGDTGKPGIYKFLDANIVSRPMRVSNSSSLASIPVVTVASVNAYLERLTAFGVNHYGIEKIEAPDFGSNEFLVNCKESILVEGEKTGKLTGDLLENILKLKDVLGETFAIAKSFDNYDLPVMARNCLENGESKNLWYEEVVPHGSIMYFGIISPDDSELDIPGVVQLGGNASIGCGYTKISRL